jgi:phage-related protein
MGAPVKEVLFIGSSHDDLLKFPDEIRREVGFAIYVAEGGDKGLNVVPLVGFGGAGVLEVVTSYDGNAYRAVYTVCFGDFIYVLHAFKKKSKSGRSTPRTDMAVVKLRLKAAQDDYEKRTSKVERQRAS